MLCSKNIMISNLKLSVGTEGGELPVGRGPGRRGDIMIGQLANLKALRLSASMSDSGTKS